MGFLLRRLVAHGRHLILIVAAAAAGGVYTYLHTHDTVAFFGGQPHVISWWEPYAWPVVTFAVVGKAGRLAFNRFVGATNEALARLKR